MKHKIVKRTVAIAVMSALLLSLGACGTDTKTVAIEPMEVEEAAAVSFDFLGGKDVMPISGYCGPFNTEFSTDGISLPNYISDEFMQPLAECGLNLFHQANINYTYSPEDVEKFMELGEKYRLGIFVYDSEICMRTGENTLSLKEMDKRINEYQNYPAFCGVYVVDEPGTSYFLSELTTQRNLPDYVPVFNNLKELNVVGAGNLNPVWHEYDYEAYNRYVEEYITTCNPPYVSFDHYVWDADRTQAGFLYNIDVIRHYCLKYNVPFWSYVQAGGQWNDSAAKFDSVDYFPSEGQLHWSVNTALACGAKGIEYFMAIQPHYFAYADSTEFDVQRNGLLSCWGTKTQWWYYAKNANAQVAAVDDVLMNSASKGVLVSGKVATADTERCKFVLDGGSFREVESVEGNAMVGCFNYQGKTALYVVNYETEYAQKVTLNLYDSYNVKLVQKAEETRLNAKNLVLDMQPGEGVLVVFE